MLFSRENVPNFPPVIINNVNIERVKTAKFLGVILNEKLSWTAHINALKSKISRYVGIMYRIKPFIPLKVRIQIYHSLVQSHLNYCSLVWGFTTKSNIESLFRQQKKGIRAIMPGPVNYFYRDGNLPTGTKPFFIVHSILTVHGIIASNSLMFMNNVFRYPHTLPHYVAETISRNVPSRILGRFTESNYEWFNSHNTSFYRNSIFFKDMYLVMAARVAVGFKIL